MTPHQKPILIAGGGVASLLLAQSLRLVGIPFIIFERDASFSFRAQGYRLRLSSEGLDAIETVLDKPTWDKFWARCGQTADAGSTQFDAITGEVTQRTLPEVLASRGGKVVGIARGDMRQTFADGCEEFIQWGRQVVGYETTDDGVRALFADGTKSDEGALLIGGEGIYSKVAKQVSAGKIKTYDTGTRVIHGQAPRAAFQDIGGEGVFHFRDDSREAGSIFVIANVRAVRDDEPADLHLGWTLGGTPGIVQVPGDSHSIIGKEAAAIAKTLAKDWHPRFKPLFDQMDEGEAASWKINCSRPSGVPHWENNPRVTVIGDAVHGMTPAGGMGANTAVCDSALLGRLLREAGGWAEGVTAAYEREMRVYASEAVQQSYMFANKASDMVIDEDTTPVV